MIEDLKFYIIRNMEGNFFRRKGFNGYGNSWVKDAENATVYQKISTARARVSYFVNSWPQFGIPEIIEMSIGEIKVLSEAKRIEKVKKNKIRQEMRRKMSRSQSLANQIEHYTNQINKLKGQL